MREIMEQLKILEKDELDLEQLILHARRLIPLLVKKQVRYKVTDFPTKRTIRYYVQKGLMDKPARHGLRSLFLYRHLLQALAVKKLQSEYLPLRKIADIMRGSGDRQLEKILTTTDEALPVSPSKPSGAIGSRPPWTSWRSFRIDDQIELSVREGFNLLDPSVDLEIINAKIVDALSTLALAQGDSSSFDRAVSQGTLSKERRLRFVPAPPVSSLKKAVVAMITEGGLVPKGNPDHLESARASRFLKYSLAEVDDLKTGDFESINRGWDTGHVNADPNRLVPLDVMREFERKKLIGKTYDYLYTTTGVATPVDAAREMGKGIAEDLRREGVSAAILTAT